MAQRFRQAAVFVGVILVALGVSVGTTAQAQVRGVTDTEVTLGVILDYTGPYKSAGVLITEAFNAYWKAVNDAGGVHGRKVKIVYEDNGASPKMGLTAANKLVYKDGVFGILGSIGSAATVVLFDLVEKEKVPMLPIAYPRKMYDPVKRYVFMASAPYAIQAARAIDYIFDNKKDLNAKVGIIYQDDDFGEDARNGALEAMKAWGKTPTAQEAFPRGTTDFRSAVLNMKRADVDYIVIGGAVREAAGIVREAKLARFKGQIMGIDPSLGPPLFSLAKEAAEGYLGASSFATVGENVPAWSNLKAALQKYEKKTFNFYHVFGLANSVVYHEGLKRAGRNLTPDTMVAALESLRDFDSGGVLPPVTFTATKRYASQAAKIVRADVKTQDFIEVAPYQVPKAMR